MTDKTKARRATLTPLANGHHLPAGASYQEAGITPSGVSVPASGLISWQSPNVQGSARTAGSMLETMADSLSQRDTCPLLAGCSRELDEPGRPLPEPSTHTTQGTGTQGKTCGLEPGPVLQPQEKEGNAVRSSPEEKELNSGQFSDCHFGESANPSDETITIISPKIVAEDCRPGN